MGESAHRKNIRATRPAARFADTTKGSGAPRRASPRSNLVAELVRAREVEHRSVRNLAEMAGVSAAAIRTLEMGRGRVATLVAVMEALPFHITGLAPGRTFAEQLPNRRVKMGKSVEAIALKATLTPSAILKIEAGGGSVAELLRLLAVIAPKARRRAEERAYWGADHKFARDSRFTPDSFMQPVYEVFGAVDLDPCGHVSSRVVARRRFLLAEGDDGLRDQWSGRLAFVNPPFSAKLPFLRRAHAQWEAGNVRTVLCLMPTSMDSTFFHETIRPVADVFILHGRLKFADENNKSQPTPHALMLVALGTTKHQRELFASRVRGFWIPAGGDAGLAETSAAAAQAATSRWVPTDHPIVSRWVEAPAPLRRGAPPRPICGPERLSARG